MTKKKNRNVGSTFESWLDEVGLREDVTVAAIKSVIAQQLADEMKKKKLTKKRVAELLVSLLPTKSYPHSRPWRQICAS